MAAAIPYLAVIVTMASGLFAFFWERDGQRRKVRGISWIAAILILLGGGVALSQIYLTARRAAAAEQAKDTAERQMMRATLGGFDFTKPFDHGVFRLEVPEAGDGADDMADPLVGPFPALPPGATGVLSLGMPGAFYHEFQLSPAGLRGLRIDNANRRDPSFLLTEANGSAQVRQAGSQKVLEGQDEEGVRPNYWGAQPGEGSLDFFLNLAPISPLRDLVNALAQRTSYGRLTLRLPHRALGGRTQLAEAYRRVKPSFVFYAPLAGGTAATDDCVSYIRVPMTMKLQGLSDSGDQRELVFDLVATAEGFNTEVCEGAP